MEALLEFSAELKKGQDGMDVVYIDFPFDVQEVYGVRGQVKVRATFDGVPYRGSLAKMGHPCHFLIVTQAIRKQLGGKKAGDTVWVTIQRDTEPRTVDVPSDLSAALDAEPAAAALFARLSYTHRKEYVQWINEAKKEETRARRIAGTVHKLIEGKKEPR